MGHKQPWVQAVGATQTPQGGCADHTPSHKAHRCKARHVSTAAVIIHQLLLPLQGCAICCCCCGMLYLYKTSTTET
jgi:hypothetical protein